jgi:outer membrane immunogenic protein
MGKIRTQLLATAALVALSSAAYAADMGMPLKAPPPAPPPVQDWSGVYVGLEGGYGWGKQNVESPFDPFFIGKLGPGCNKEFGSGECVHPTVGSMSQSGWLGGGFAGVQKQWGSWVLGIEASVDGADIKGSTTAANTNIQLFDNSSTGCGALATPCRFRTVNSTQTFNSEIDMLGFAGPKVGWAISPNWLVYATGGLAWAHMTENNSFGQTHFFTGPVGGVSTVFPTFTDIPTTTGDGGLSMFGWAVGAGLDWKWQIDPGSAWILGVQYMHYQFGSDTLTLSDNTFGTGISIGQNIKESVDTIKGRISYLFSIH